MKAILCSVSLLTILAAGVVLAEKEAPKPPTTKPVNTMCAVMADHPVDDRVVYMHEGKAIGFCCSDCIPTFKENPAKYTDKMK